MSRKTVGKHSVDLLSKKPETRDPIALQREMQREFEQNLTSCMERGKRTFVGKDFFVVVETKREPLMENVIRNYFFFRQSCPTPTYDNTVYHYHSNGDWMEFLWVVPSKDTCELFKRNALNIHPEERDLLDNVLLFFDGSLLELAKRLNGEVLEKTQLHA